MRSALLAVLLCTAGFFAVRPSAAQTLDSARVDVLYWISAVHINTYTAHVLIANRTDAEIPFWNLIFDLDSEITFLNHALWEQDENGTRVAVEGSGWTKRIPPKDSVWFNFSVKYDSSFHQPRNCFFSAKPCRFVTNFEGDGSGDGDDGDGDNGGDGDNDGGPVAAADVHVDFWYSSVWENGYVAWISIKNLERVPVYGWALSFDFAQPIGIIWNGKLSLTGRRYTIRDDGWNRRINPGDSVAFGFQGTYAGVPRKPSNCVFNGVKCAFHDVIDINNSQRATSSEKAALDGFALQVAPNPAHSLTRIELGVDEAQHVHVELVDLQGRIVETLFDGYIPAGDRRIVNADVSKRASGLYMIRMRAESGLVKHRPVVIVR